MQKFLKHLVSVRMVILSVTGAAVYIALNYFHISIWYILLAGVVSGVLLGKVFCRWACPIGLFMEILMSLLPGGKVKSMYQYHKLGCPIAWVSGWLNKMSLAKIRLNYDTCRKCGVCDKKCYIVAVEPSRYSLYKPKAERPGDSYSCSRCLECVASCPNGSLKFKA